MAHQEININERLNARGIKEYYCNGMHLSLETLTNMRSSLSDEMKGYLSRREPSHKYHVPDYPSPVEFQVSHVAHVTVKEGFEGILESEGFRPPSTELSWWDLKITEDEIRAAEKLYRKNCKVNQDEEFLPNFTTSPLFQNQSRYGNYRFTFPLSDLMQWYKEQNCGGEEPVLRVFETITYKQEIVYTVLIHSPDDNECFEGNPLLEESKWVQYQDGKIIWKAQAICETHSYQFVDGRMQEAVPSKFYVWDQVSLVFHVPNKTKPAKALKIPRERLIEALEACELDENIHLKKNQPPKQKEQRTPEKLFSEAQEKVSQLKTELEEKKEVKKREEDMKMEVDE